MRFLIGSGCCHGNLDGGQHSKNNTLSNYFKMAQPVGVHEIVLSINSSVSMNEPHFEKNVMCIKLSIFFGWIKITCSKHVDNTVENSL